MSKKQKIVLAAAAVYLLAIGFLILFSDRLMKAALPEVKLCAPYSASVSGEGYNTVLPKECIFANEKGMVIYELARRETPLGVRYYVYELQIEILAEDGTQAAIRPVLEPDAQIVRSSSGELKDGMQVSLKNLSLKAGGFSRVVDLLSFLAA